MKKYPCSGIILADDQKSNLNGLGKAWMELDGRRVLDHLLTVFEAFFEEIILVAAEPAAYLAWDLLIVSDHYRPSYPVTGIHAGLFAARSPHALVATCDMPLIRPSLIKHLLDVIEPRWDAIVPRTEKGLEPLPAVFSKRCLMPMEQKMAVQPFPVQRFLQQLHTKTIDMDCLRRHDPELVSLIKTDSPAELAQALERLKQYTAHGE